MDKINILAALDGSEASGNVINYVEDVFPPDNSEIVLFHVSVEIPNAFWDEGSLSDLNFQRHSTRAWLREQDKTIREFMENSKKKLINKGFKESAITIKIQPRKVGVARDIVEESKNGYSVMVIGRTGLSKLKDILLGSTASKLLGKIDHIPMVVVGKKGNYQNFLIAYDGSEGSEKAITSAGSLTGNSACMFRLCNVIRPLNIMYLNEMQKTFPINDVEWMEDNKKKMEPKLDAAAKKLVDFGIPRTRVSKKILTDHVSRAGGIMEEVKDGDFGTVVVGRRDLSFIEEFFQGRVGKKIFKMASDQAVWIVS